MQISGNTILVTGGGSGIGRAFAEALHAKGNQIIVAGRRREKLDQVTAANPDFGAVQLDVEDPASIASAASELAERFPQLNVLVNNAGIMRAEDVKAGDVSTAEATVNTNLLGPIRLTTALLPLLMKQDRAAIMNVTSGLAYVPLCYTPTYCATKAALHSYTLSLRQQLKDTSVDVIEIVPPYVQTTLMGDHQATDARAMPLDEYVADTMKILTERPEVDEVIIERVAPMRYAEANGTFGEVFGMLTQMGEE